MCAHRRPLVHFHALRGQQRAGDLDKRPGWKGSWRYVRIVEVEGSSPFTSTTKSLVREDFRRSSTYIPRVGIGASGLNVAFAAGTVPAKATRGLWSWLVAHSRSSAQTLSPSGATPALQYRGGPIVVQATEQAAQCFGLRSGSFGLVLQALARCRQSALVASCFNWAI